MAISARLILDSVGPAGTRITTWEATYHRYIHSELLTHRCLSRNSASTRAISTPKFRKAVQEDPAIPLHWGKQQSGMQAEGELEGERLSQAQEWWLQVRTWAVQGHSILESLGLHKQVANRVLEPWQWMTTIITGTHFGGWFKLRDHRMAQPEIRELAAQMRELYQASTPQQLEKGQWHIPFLSDRAELEAEGYELGDLLKIGTGRIARVSYLTHDGVRDPAKDIELHDRLLNTGDDPPHMSPFEHSAQALDQQTWNEMILEEYRDACRGMRCFNPMKFGNLVGWDQYRKWVAVNKGVDESGFSFDWRKKA